MGLPLQVRPEGPDGPGPLGWHGGTRTPALRFEVRVSTGFVRQRDALGGYSFGLKLPTAGLLVENSGHHDTLSSTWLP